MCLIQFENKSGKWACLFQESVFVFHRHVTLLLTDMWQQFHANPKPDCNHMTAHTSPVYSKCTTCKSGIILSSVNNDQETYLSLFPSSILATLLSGFNLFIRLTDHQWCGHHLDKDHQSIMGLKTKKPQIQTFRQFKAVIFSTFPCIKVVNSWRNKH